MSDVFDMQKWETAMDITGISAADFAAKTYERSDKLPWEHIDIGVTKEFLWKENQKAVEACITPDCSKICQKCGLGCNEQLGVKGPESKAEDFCPSYASRLTPHDFALDYQLNK